MKAKEEEQGLPAPKDELLETNKINATKLVAGDLVSRHGSTFEFLALIGNMVVLAAIGSGSTKKIHRDYFNEGWEKCDQKK